MTTYQQFARSQETAYDLQHPRARQLLEAIVCKLLRHEAKIPAAESVNRLMFDLGLDPGAGPAADFSPAEFSLYMSMLTGLGILAQLAFAKEKM